MRNNLRRIFLPHADIADLLQAHFGFPRRPACRTQHGRFEVTVRGAGVTSQSVEQCVALAEAIAVTVRPLLTASHRHITRRSARYALRVTFEDERVVGHGVATSSLSYVATMRDVAERADHPVWHPGRWI